MNIERLAVTRLTPAPYNPRVPLKPGDPGFEKLRRSLQEFELVQPLVWNRRTGHLVGGHQRLEVLKSEGQEEVDCVVVDLPLEREKALNIALNNANVGGRWDPSSLTELLHELIDDPEIDATLTGFDEVQLRDLLLTPADDFEPPEEDAESSDVVVVTLECPPADWPEVEASLNTLLKTHQTLRLHIKPTRK